LATIEETKVGIIPADKMGGPHKNHQTHRSTPGGRAGVMSIKCVACQQLSSAKKLYTISGNQ
jgi:hypothetical protein